VLLFRELNENPEFTLDLSKLFRGDLTAVTLGGRGESQLKNGHLTIRIPAPLDFLWVRLDPVEVPGLRPR
jgi:hypothetical protein